jgi:hypothetical protein
MRREIQGFEPGGAVRSLHSHRIASLGANNKNSHDSRSPDLSISRQISIHEMTSA